MNEKTKSAWIAHSNTILAHRAIEEEREHEEWLDENFGPRGSVITGCEDGQEDD